MYHSCRKAICDTYKSAAEIQRAKESGEISSKKLRGSMLRSSAAAGKGGRILAAKQVNPTRMELTRLKKKRITAIRGHKLLKDKRDELMRQYLDLVRENMEVRKKVEAGIRSANKNFVIAKAGMSEAALNTALMAPKQEVNLEAGEKTS